MKANIKLGRSANLLSILSMSSALLLSSSVVNAAGRGDRGEFSLPGYYTTVPLGAATQFVILSQSGITDVPTSVVTGNVGVSPITGAADHLTCAEVTGMVYSVDAAGPQPCSIMKPTKLTNAVNDMQAAYTDAAGRAPTVLNLGAGNIGGLTLPPGVYNWTTGVTIPSNITLDGPKYGVWIFQIAGDLDVSSGVGVILLGQAHATRIFWQVAGATNLGTTSHLEGTVLDATAINLGTDASINGRLLAQTAVTLEMNTVTAVR